MEHASSSFGFRKTQLKGEDRVRFPAPELLESRELFLLRSLELHFFFIQLEELF
jgi:hypothetical protein